MSNVQLAYETAGEEQLPTGRLTEMERRAAILAALDKMPPDEKAAIIALAKDLISELKHKNYHTQISLEGAIEAIAGIGMMIVKKNGAK